KIPESRHPAGAGIALTQENPTVLADHEQRAIETNRFEFAKLDRQLSNCSRNMRTARRPDRAEQTERIAGQADRGAELHEGLVEVTGLAWLEPLLCDGAEAFPSARAADIGRIVLHARDHTQHIAIEHGARNRKGDAGNGSGGVIADSGKSADRVVVLGEATV